MGVIGGEAVGSDNCADYPLDSNRPATAVFIHQLCGCRSSRTRARQSGDCRRRDDVAETNDLLAMDRGLYPGYPRSPESRLFHSHSAWNFCNLHAAGKQKLSYTLPHSQLERMVIDDRTDYWTDRFHLNHCLYCYRRTESR